MVAWKNNQENNTRRNISHRMRQRAQNSVSWHILVGDLCSIRNEEEKDKKKKKS